MTVALQPGFSSERTGRVLNPFGRPRRLVTELQR